MFIRERLRDDHQERALVREKTIICTETEFLVLMTDMRRFPDRLKVFLVHLPFQRVPAEKHLFH